MSQKVQAAPTASCNALDVAGLTMTAFAPRAHRSCRVRWDTTPARTTTGIHLQILLPPKPTQMGYLTGVIRTGGDKLSGYLACRFFGLQAKFNLRVYGVRGVTK